MRLATADGAGSAQWGALLALELGVNSSKKFCHATTADPNDPQNGGGMTGHMDSHSTTNAEPRERDYTAYSKVILHVGNENPNTESSFFWNIQVLVPAALRYHIPHRGSEAQ
jgi:hypothetical protein